MKLEPEYIEKLAKIITDNGLTEISMEDGDQAITIRKDLPEVMMAPAAASVSPAVVQSAQPAKTTEEAPAAEVQGKAITSPMVGTFSSASSPEAAPFVEIGSEVAVGDVVCIIEAM
ncbi:acetyl-CoA carboxylase biotin carboxyl carrier protein, partial [bacterium]|nr:acetyl-CoA carboxylase biotin carboxyl carrier protein [bacterium]